MNLVKLLPSPKLWPFFYGWMILFVGAIGLLVSAPGQTIGVSAFTDSLIQVLSLSRDELSLAYMGGTMISAVLLTKAGKFFDQYGAMRTAIFACLGLGLALCYLSRIDWISSLLGPARLRTMIVLLVGFVCIRFFGQGMLTLACRTMIVNWFEVRRGLAVGLLGIATSYGFSMAPVFFDSLISDYDWSGAWLVLALIVGLIFSIFVLLFFKDEPEKYGLIPDGFLSKKTNQKINKFPVVKEFTLHETRRNSSFWILCGLPAMFGLYMTGFTFHVVSIFAEQGIERSIAIHIFQPIAIVSIISTIICSLKSDHVKIKYLAFYFGICFLFATIGVRYLSAEGFFYWLLIVSYGAATGIATMFISLFLPRFFGRQHLGSITGQAMTLMVFGSAIGPILFSQSLSLYGNYDLASYFCGAVVCCLLGALFFITNPQTTN